MLEGCGFLRWKVNLMCTNNPKVHFSVLSHSDAMAPNVKSGGYEGTCTWSTASVATFREMQDLGVDWMTKPCVTQHIERSLHFDNTQWPGNSPELNPTENLGANMKERVERRWMVRIPPNDFFQRPARRLHSGLHPLCVVAKSAGTS